MAITTGANCQDCIFNMREDEQTTYVRQSIGATLCGAGHGPTAIPTGSASQNTKIGELKAAGCTDFTKSEPGSPAPTLRTTPTPPIVMLPDPETVGQVPSDAGTLVRSCLQCKNFITPQVALEAGLWSVGMCAARGVMILNTEVVSAANGCASKDAGIRDSTAITRMQFVPEYAVGMNIGTIPTGGIVADATPEVVEPTTYKTDKPITEDDTATGIRAWRELKDPESANVVYLPIYDLDFFEEAVRESVPRTGDDEHPEEYVDHQGLAYKCAVLWMHLNETPALWGVAGTGKTEFYRYMAWMMCLPFNRISVTASTEIEDLAGKMHFSPERGTYFEYGRIPRAWKQAGIICLDEPNVGPPDVWQFIRPLTDNSKQLVLDMNNGERIGRHPSAFLGLAMNPAWDVRNVGTGMLADADGSRLMHIYVDLPSKEIERKILKARCKLDDFEISEEQLDAVMGIAADLRALCADDTLPITWGIRPQIKVARALKWFSMPSAYRLATADYLEPSHQEIILDTVKTHTRPAPRSFSTPPTPVGRARAARPGTR